MKLTNPVSAAVSDLTKILDTAVMIRVLDTGEVCVVYKDIEREEILPKGGVDILYVYSTPTKIGIGTTEPIENVLEVMMFFLAAIPQTMTSKTIWHFCGRPTKDITFLEVYTDDSGSESTREFTLYVEGGAMIFFNKETSPFAAYLHEGDKVDGLVLTRH